MSHPPPQADSAWFCAGPSSSYPNVDGTTRVGAQYACRDTDTDTHRAGCRIFHVPRGPGAQQNGTEVAIDAWKDGEPGRAKDQVIVFQYKGKFCAIDHECPHASYPLSNGTPFDVEDFGVVLSAGITCPKHAWSFDLHTGQADRGKYRLHVWDVQQRPSRTVHGDVEIWIRRKEKRG